MSRTSWQRRSPDFWIKQNDTSPTVSMQLQDGAGVNIDGTGATVKFMAWFPGEATVKINSAGSITAGGIASYTFSATDSNTVGDMMAEWQVTFGGGAVETFPNGEWLKVRVKDDIAA